MPRDLDFERLAYLRSVFGGPPSLRVSELSRHLAELEDRAARWVTALGEDPSRVELVKVVQFGGGAVVLFSVWPEFPDGLTIQVDKAVFVTDGEVLWSQVLDYT